MIPHPSAGVQPWGHPLRAVNSGSGRVDVSQGLTQSEMPPISGPQPQARPPAVIDLTTSSAESQEREPPAKRQRLDVPSASALGDASPASAGGAGEAKNTPGPTTSRPPAMPWRGRPVWSFQALISEAPGGGGELHAETAATLAQGGRPASPPPFPTLPWKYPPPELVGADEPRESSPVGEVQTTPYRIQVPSIAPVLKGQNVADFSPWTGDHPEDVLNEHSAKQGHYDRTQVSQNESNTARPSLYAQLKHRSGLQLLSSVFAAALEKRQSHSVVTAPSTFKPPPRVTLTDNKREAWLRDLANPSVPLRRLSRTIPHGIRGKVLLDQCLSKLIPASRAVWLAKCVGANEIRAFKRKGTSGALAIGLEAKWVRDWTTNVQQFLESVLSACGTADWRMKVTYAVSLTARLFFEHLLDYDHFLAWFLSSLELAPLNTLPVWLLMLGIYWDNILRYRKRGRRLAELLLEKLRQATHSEQAGTLQPLIDRLTRCLRKLIYENTSSVILPNSWDVYKDTVSSCLSLEDNVDKTIFQSLAERNARVQAPKNPKRTAQRSPQQRIIYLFDSMCSTHDISISTTCLNTVEDRAALVGKLLEWTATPFRHGICRVYASVRLLRKWKSAGVDIESHILAFLTQTRGDSRLDMGNVYHTISELVRSQTFSVGKYLQWLMAKGVTNGSQQDENTVLPNEVGLLAQLPVSRLPEYVRNLRNTLLARAGLSVSEEESTIAALKASIGQRLPKVFGVDAENTMSCDLTDLNLTWAVKYEIGQWIRRGVTEHCRVAPRHIPRVGLSADTKVSALAPDEFYHLRDILENFGDLSILADVIKLATNCDDNTVLASAADTIGYHFDSFCIIGATTDLFKGLIEAYARLKRLGATSLELVFSLIEIGLQVPHESNTMALLRQDLSRIESKSALAAPSPLSDHIPEAFNEADPSFPEKLNQLLSSGGGIDEITLDALFCALTKILQFGDDQGKLTPNDTCRYLAHLRPFHPKHFDVKLVRWVCSVLKSTSRPPLSKLLPPLVGVGCVTIHAFVSLVKKLSLSETTGVAVPHMSDLQMDVLELLLPPSPRPTGYCDLVTYRFHLAQQEFLAKYPEETFGIIHDAAALMKMQNQESVPGPRQTDLARCMTALLCELLTRHPERAPRYCTQKLIDQHSASITALQGALDSLLGFDTPAGPDTNLPEAERVINMTNDFSLPFCQLKLQVLFNAESGEEIGNGIVDVMFKAAVADSRSKKSNWVGLVALMSQAAVRQIRERAEKGFFSVPMFDSPTDDHSPGAADNTGSLETAKLYLTIIEELASSIPDTGVHSIAPLLVEKMDLLLHKLIIMQTNFSSVTENGHGTANDQMLQSRSNFEKTFAFWFSALLRMVVIHRSAFHVLPYLAPKPNGLQEQARILISIFCVSLSRLPDSAMRLYPTANYFPHTVQPDNCRPCPGILLQTHALDVAASLIDTFPDEARAQCMRFLKEKCPPFSQHQSDSRFLYLLGPMADTTPTNASQPAAAPSPMASGPASTPTPSGNTSQQSAAQLSGLPSGLSETSSGVSSRLRLQHRGRKVGAYPVRPWELLEGAAPIMGANDTAVNLGYFDARRVRT